MNAPASAAASAALWAAQKRYPYIALNTSIEQTKKIWDVYDTAAEEVGYTPGPENHGYLLQCHISDTEEKALRNARQFRWMQGEFTGLAHPVWSTPSGYSSPANRRAFVEFSAGLRANPREDGRARHAPRSAKESRNSTDGSAPTPPGLLK